MAAYISFQPTDFFNTILYNGTASQQAITGVGFQPDYTWIKRREVNWHCLVDAVRGATKRLSSNVNNAEVTDATAVESLDTDGFTVGIDSNGYTNQSGGTYVAWNWKTGTTSGIATNGSTTITPTAYSFNQTAGISIVQYTGNETAGAGLAHGLGAVPGLMIFKRLDGATPWQVYHQSLGPTKNMVLNTTGLEETYTTRYNDTAPDSVNAILGTTTYINKSGSPHVGYIFAEKKGFSSFSKYTGNGNADGPFIYTGFRPAFVITKSFSASANGWYVMDRLRSNPYNSQDGRLEADSSGAENDTAIDIDFLSNGFKLRSSDGGFNTSGTEYIYMAFAEFPVVSSNSKAGVAR